MEILNKSRWAFSSPDEEEVRHLVEGMGVSRIVAQLLLNRGIDSVAKAEKFFAPSLNDCYNPFTMKGMEKAVEKVWQALRQKKKILVFGDFDVDGITGTSVIYRALSRVSDGCIFAHVPDRMLDGYGLNESILTYSKEKSIDIIVTVDCGISCKKEAELAKELGIDLIITDHHHPPDELPDAFAIINPKQSGCGYPFKDLAGVGIALKFLHGIFANEVANYSKTAKYLPLPESLWEHLDLVALGTIADIVPLLDENRIFVKHGLNALTTSRKPGIRALKKAAALDYKAVTSFDVGFKLAPRINAAGRIGNAKQGLELLTTESENLAETLAKELEQKNKERKTIENKIFDQAMEMYNAEKRDDQKIIVLTSNEWHQGVIGIVASRLSDKFFLPTILIAVKNGVGRGSGRSIPSFHIHETICGCEDLLVNFGGHKCAAGLTINEENIPEFKQRIEALAKDRLEEEDTKKVIDIDNEIHLDDFSLDDMEDIERLAPFGEANNEPVFFSKELEVINHPSIVGNNHLRMKVRKNRHIVDVIGFKMGDYKRQLDKATMPFDIVFIPQVNSWRNKDNLQLKMKDIRSSA